MKISETFDIDLVEEPQLAFKYETKEFVSSSKTTLRMLSLFSGCGGMDLGFEGEFSVLRESVN